MSLMVIVTFIAGLIFLLWGAEWLVKGAARLAAIFGISPLIIGLTVVALGTSSPELAVSIKSAFAGQADIAVGNVIGSNIFNILFILGISAIVAPLIVSRQLIRLDVPIMIITSILLLLLTLDGMIGKLDAAILTAGLLTYVGFLFYESRKGNASVEETPTEKKHGAKNVLLDLFFIAAGLALLIFGSRWLVNSSVEIARAFGVNELVIGLTIIAAGTSMPEVATSIMASLRGERDIAVGNVVGSNIFNILCVLGISGLVAPDGIAVARQAITIDLPVMVVVALFCFPIFFTGWVISRREGIILLLFYIAYTTFLVMNASGSTLLNEFAIIAMTAVPVTMVVLGTKALRQWSVERAKPA